MATKARKMSEGVQVTLDTLPGQNLTCIVPHDQVEKARELYVAYQQAEAAAELGLASQEERESAEGAWSEYIVEVRCAAYRPDYGVDPEGDPKARREAQKLWNQVESNFIDVFKNRFERGL